MHLPPFALERYFARWEFNVRHLLCASDAETWGMDELLAMADDEARALWRDLRLGYTESAGHPLLRAEIARRYERIAPDETLVFAGAEEAIFTLANVLLEPGEHAIVLWPAYQSLHEVARAAGAAVDLLPLDPARGWALDLDHLQRLLRPTTRLIIVNFPHNPTGAHPDAETFQALVAMARFSGCWLLSDEVYRGLEYRDEDVLPAACDLYEHAISLGVMSKAHGLAGLRIGWIATRDREVLRRAAAFKDYTTICSSAPSEILSLIALRAEPALLARNRGIVRANLDCLDRFFSDWAHAFAWTRPRAGSVAFPALTAGLSIDDFAAGLVEQEGVLLLPGTQLGYPGNHFRLGFGRADMREALEGMDRYCGRVMSTE
ncbi:MAG TPA: aminotransferase class I/II-fold pyridoxal phosphate-dependent enzyme [Gemmatimonadaceae bacterium]|nr:aminotransferase class I/II-fold pyridoxal phosphate-dependent enzyme [Gemmatimonadaceae bacterium]